MPIDPAHVTTAFELPQARIVRNIGLVRGIVVRSRSIVGNIGASLQTLIGGNITLYTELCERARSDAFRLMKCLRDLSGDCSPARRQAEWANLLRFGQ